MKVYVTRYALTKGIYQVEAKLVREGMVEVKSVSGTMTYYLHGKDWHETKESAIARAEEMRKTKIGSLKKQVARFEKMDFERTCK